MRINADTGAAEFGGRSSKRRKRWSQPGSTRAQSETPGVVNLNFGQVETHVAVPGDIHGDLNFS
ncbi:hypothetical protein [Saccharopolyspora spinosa]|uniref:Uncharacterized protein n=1 Tax=Saccharopolyspora spinosa TaxID=60894 RepID=A0A2N3XUQ1_SACSN|nr:hypothetical protein [Saccharopolyspora spinosa]PKW14413.1 hypothetical protein A8926_2026 [Saccharopolyspora spinosa]